MTRDDVDGVADVVDRKSRHLEARQVGLDGGGFVEKLSENRTQVLGTLGERIQPEVKQAVVVLNAGCGLDKLEAPMGAEFNLEVMKNRGYSLVLSLRVRHEAISLKRNNISDFKYSSFWTERSRGQILSIV